MKWEKDHKVLRTAPAFLFILFHTSLLCPTAASFIVWGLVQSSTEADLDTFCRSVISHIKNEGNVLPTYFNPACPFCISLSFPRGKEGAVPTSFPDVPCIYSCHWPAENLFMQMSPALSLARHRLTRPGCRTLLVPPWLCRVVGPWVESSAPSFK